MSDSDSEFEKFLQESVSSSAVSSSLSVTVREAAKNKEKDADRGEEDQGLSSTGLSWLKTTGPSFAGKSIELTLPSLADREDDDSWMHQSQDSFDVERLVPSQNQSKSLRRKISTASSVDDPLTYSVGSGFSVLSEIEHQLGLRSSGRVSQQTPGQDTLEEESEKRRFFEQLEAGGNTLDYSELNRQLTDSGRSLRATGELIGAHDHILRTINEDEGPTPRYSEDEFEEESSSDHRLPAVNKPPVLEPNLLRSGSAQSVHSSLSSSSRHSITLSPIHSLPAAHRVPATLSQTSEKLVPIPEMDFRTLAPVVSKSSSSVVVSKDPALSTPIMAGMQKTAKADQTEGERSQHLVHTVLEPSLQMQKSGSSMSEHSALVAPPVLPHQSQIDSDSSSTSVATSTVSVLGSAPALAQRPLSTQRTEGLPSALISGGNSASADSHQYDPQTTLVSEEESIEQLLRELAAEELASASYQMIKDDSLPSQEKKEKRNLSVKQSSVSPSRTKRVVNSPVRTKFKAPLTQLQAGSRKPKQSSCSESRLLQSTRGTTSRKPSSETGNVKLKISPDLSQTPSPEVKMKSSRVHNLSAGSSPNHLCSIEQQQDNNAVQLKLEAEHKPKAWEEMKKRVIDLEEDLKESARREERTKLDCLRQMQEVKGELTATRAKLRSLEREQRTSAAKAKTASQGESGGDLKRETEEQEKLIHGYQKENERLYDELTSCQKDLKAVRNQLLEENNRMAAKLANARNQILQQKETICHLREQQDAYNPQPPSEEGQREQLARREKVDHMQTQLEEARARSMKLETQVRELIGSNQTLEHQLRLSRTGHGQEVGGTTTEEFNRMQKTYQEQVETLKDQLCRYSEQERMLEEVTVTLGKKEQEILELHGKLEKAQLDINGRSSKMLKSRTAADARKIRELQRQVHELQTAIKRRFPNSIPALIYASEGRASDVGEPEESSRGSTMTRHLEAQVCRLEEGLRKKEDDYGQRVHSLQQKHLRMEALYSDQVDSLKQQISGLHEELASCRKRLGQASAVIPGESYNSESGDSALAQLRGKLQDSQTENKRLRDQVSQLEVELAHQRLKLEGQLAQTEGERHRLEEHWEQKIKSLNTAHSEKLDRVIAKFARQRTDSDHVRLRSRIKAHEATIKHMQDQLAICEEERKALAVSQLREEELEKQVELLTQQLLEAKRHHTPEMHHFSSLLAHVSQLELKLKEQESQAKHKANRHTDGELKEVERRYARQLQSKNSQIQQFREELDSLLDALHVLQEGAEMAGQ